MRENGGVGEKWLGWEGKERRREETEKEGKRKTERERGREGEKETREKECVQR